MSVVRDFEKLLTDFFSLYHPRQVKKVGAIAQEFKGQEVAVLKLLCDKYKKAYKVVPGLVDAIEVHTPAPVVEVTAKTEETEEELIQEPVEEYTEEVEEEDTNEIAEDDELTVEEEEVTAEEEEEENK